GDGNAIGHLPAVFGMRVLPYKNHFISKATGRKNSREAKNPISLCVQERLIAILPKLPKRTIVAQLILPVDTTHIVVNSHILNRNGNRRRQLGEISSAKKEQNTCRN